MAHLLFTEASGEGSGQPGLERALVQILVRVASIHVRNLKPDARSRVPGEAYCARGDATLSGVRELLERRFFFNESANRESRLGFDSERAAGVAGSARKSGLRVKSGNTHGSRHAGPCSGRRSPFLLTLMPGERPVGLSEDALVRHAGRGPSHEAASGAHGPARETRLL